MLSNREDLPSLLYLADVPVEASYHGSALVFRLLQGWPPEMLRVIEGDFYRSLPQRRLPGVQYATLRLGWRRLAHTRFAQWHNAWQSWRAASQARRIAGLLGDFKPQAILTVTHGHLWLTAAAYARAYGLPLHLICHDDWPRVAAVPQQFSGWLDQQFRAVYQFATSRLCVSPAMREAYRARYGAEGEVLYPSRAADCVSFDAPPERLSGNNTPFTVAFGGTINSSGYVRALDMLATALEKVNGKLLIFGPLTADDAQRNGLNRANIELGGLLTSAQLMQRFRQDVDALFVPMSFDEKDRPNMEVAFPSKLTDYTAVGLPLLIYGPNYCSAVRWARENPGVAEVVECESQEALSYSVQRLAAEPAARLALGQRALEVGRRYFALEAVQQTFFQALLQS